MVATETVELYIHHDDHPDELAERFANFLRQKLNLEVELVVPDEPSLILKIVLPANAVVIADDPD